MEPDVIVIGGGYAGLSAGAILAYNGKKVLLLEKATVLGGRAHYIEKDGFLLEYGIHANRNASEGAAAAVFRKVGKTLDFIEPGEPELWLNGKFVPLPSNVPKIVKSKDIGTKTKLNAALMLVKLVAGKPEKLFPKAVDEMVSRSTPEETLMLMRVLSGIGIIAPDLKNSSAGEFGAYLKAALKAKVKVAYPRHGTRQIIDTLKSVIEGSGEIRTGANVEHVSIKNGKVDAVKVDGQMLSAPVVIGALPIQQLPELFGGKDLPLRFVKYAQGLIPTAGISLDFGLSKKISERDGLLVTSDPVTMGQFTSNIDPSAAPAGKQLGTWYYPLPAGWLKNDERMQREADNLKKMLAEMFPGIWEALEWERLLFMPMVDGFLPKPGQTRLERPDFSMPGISNFFLAGDTTKAEGTGGDTAFNSAIAVAELVLNYLD